MATFNGTEGNDTIVGGADSDVINGNGGNDSLLGGDGSDTVRGGAGNDFLSGNTGADWVEGGTGNDEVRGGSGQDSIAFHEFGAANADILSDFDAGWDNIQLDASAFTAIGAAGRMSSGDARFFSGTAAHDADDRIIYNSATGQLFYDADGNGAGAQQLIATISNHSALSATDIWMFGSAPTGQTINGTAGDDTLVGGPGNDTLNGFGGNDSLLGNDGDDSLNGGDGNDTMDGGNGTDTLNGGLGDDTYINPEVIVDAGGTDTVIRDNVSGTRLESGMENLIVRGHTDNPDPEIDGNELNNRITIESTNVGYMVGGGAGDDTIVGSASFERFLFSTGHDVIDGGGGGNVLLMGPAPAGVTVDMRTGTGSDSAGNSVSFTNIATIYGSGFNDLITADDAGRSLNGQEGNDTLIGGAGNDTLGGDTTFDFPREPLGLDSLVGGAGNDRLDGGRGDDTLDGGTGNDTLNGGNDNDIFRFSDAPGAANADLITGFESGKDSVVLLSSVMPALGASGSFSADDARFYAAAGATGGHDADDRVVYDTSTGNLYYDADGSGTGGAQLIATLRGFGGGTTPEPSTLVASDIAVDTVTAPRGQTIDGTAGNDSLTAGAGNDFMFGGDGNDTLNGGDGNDTIFGQGGDDSLIGGNGLDALDGGDGNDTLDGTSFGPVGGFAGEHDTLDGGAGNDTYIVDANDVTIADPGGTDSVIAWDTSWTLGAGLENLTLRQTARADGSSATGNELNNVIDVSTLDHSGVVHGMGGNDTIFGGQHSGALFGDDGNDVLHGEVTTSLSSMNGGAGDDVLIAGATGSMTGDTGADSFVFLHLNGNTVTDFASGTDKIHLDARDMTALGATGNFSAGDVRFFAAAGATGGHDGDNRVVYDTSTGNLWYDSDGSGTSTAQLIARLQGAPALSATDIAVDNGTTPTPTPTPGQTINGTSGNDTIVGGAGNDTIWGNSGNDWLEGRGGNDQLSGGSGQDSYVFREFGAANADRLLQFDSSWDAMRFDSSAFTALGGPGHFSAGDARFFAGAGANAGHDADDRIVYNTSTGQLYYDADGAGGADAQLVATVQGAGTVAASDIWVI